MTDQTPTTPTTSENATGSAVDAAVAQVAETRAAEASSKASAMETSLLGGGEAVPPTEQTVNEDGTPVVNDTPFNIEPIEGFDGIDNDALAEVSPVLRQFGIDNDAKAQDFLTAAAPVVQGMVQRAVEGYQASVTAAMAEENNTWVQQVQADPAFQGTQRAESLKSAARFIDNFGGDQVRNPDGTPMKDDQGRPFNALRLALYNNPIGNHPALAQAFVQAGKAIGEGSFHLTNPSGQVQRTGAEALYDPVFDTGAKT